MTRAEAGLMRLREERDLVILLEAGSTEMTSWVAARMLTSSWSTTTQGRMRKMPARMGTSDRIACVTFRSSSSSRK